MYAWHSLLSKKWIWGLVGAAGYQESGSFSFMVCNQQRLAGLHALHHTLGLLQHDVLAGVLMTVKSMYLAVVGAPFLFEYDLYTVFKVHSPCFSHSVRQELVLLTAGCGQLFSSQIVHSHLYIKAGNTRKHYGRGFDSTLSHLLHNMIFIMMLIRLIVYSRSKGPHSLQYLSAGQMISFLVTLPF